MTQLNEINNNNSNDNIMISKREYTYIMKKLANIADKQASILSTSSLSSSLSSPP